MSKQDVLRDRSEFARLSKHAANANPVSFISSSPDFNFSFGIIEFHFTIRGDLFDRYPQAPYSRHAQTKNFSNGE